jgi:ferredoxin/flavodoxin---NADP+ reductase
MPNAIDPQVVTAQQGELTNTEKYTTERITWMHRWAPTLFSFRLSRAAAYQFTPGQFARLGLRKEDGQFVWRAYSLCSAPGADYLEFFSVVVPQGEFTSRLCAYDVGATVLVERKAQGFLTADRFYRNAGRKDLWMLATGTGLGPYLSILQDPQTWQQFENIIVVHSVRHAIELAYAEVLKVMQERPPFGNVQAKLRYVATVTRENAHGTLQGRIPALIDDGQLENAAGLAFSHDWSRFMLCGNPEMVEQTRKLLKDRGFRNDRKLEPGHIAVENYW